VIALLTACGTSDVPRGLVVVFPGGASGYVYYSPLMSSTTYPLEAVSGDVVHTWEGDYKAKGFQEPLGGPLRKGISKAL
jgi:hypothetical protein